VIYADSGYMKVTPDETALSMVLYSGYSYSDMNEQESSGPEKRYPFRKDVFKEQTIVVSLSGFDLERTEIDLFKSNSAMKNIAQLTYDIDSLNKRYVGKVDEYYSQYTNSLLYNVKNYTALDKSDTAKLKIASRPVFNAKVLFDSLSVIDKKTVVTKAIENIKAGSSFLNTQSTSLHADVQFIKRYEVNWHKKFTLSVACLVFFLIGAPLGAIIRKGGLGTPAVISVLFFVIWYVVSLSGEKLVEENLVSSTAGMWASTYILLPVGIFLTYKASTDSVIMNVDTYVAIFRKIKDSLYRKFIIGTKRNPSSKE